MLGHALWYPGIVAPARLAQGNSATRRLSGAGGRSCQGLSSAVRASTHGGAAAGCCDRRGCAWCGSSLCGTADCCEGSSSCCADRPPKGFPRAGRPSSVRVIPTRSVPGSLCCVCLRCGRSLTVVDCCQRCPIARATGRHCLKEGAAGYPTRLQCRAMMKRFGCSSHIHRGGARATTQNLGAGMSCSQQSPCPCL
jgi:hypothetical protein